MTTGQVYVGSTAQPRLCQRLRQHLSAFRQNKSVSSRNIIEGGNYNIVLLEEFPCENKDQLHARERYWIDTTDCINKNRPVRTIDEKKEYHATYRELHRDKLTEYYSQYRIDNADTLREKRREYYETNNDKILEQKREYYKANREKRLAYMREYDRKKREALKNEV
jgi:hypothetical protein